MNNSDGQVERWINEQTYERINKEWMSSGAHGSTHDPGARGPGFDPTSKPTTDLKTK